VAEENWETTTGDVSRREGGRQRERERERACFKYIHLCYESCQLNVEQAGLGLFTQCKQQVLV